MSEKILVYFLYIAISCLFTSGLNIIHAEYMLKIALTPRAFIAPIFAGLLFGYLLARIKLLQEQMSLMAFTDPLTSIYNRLHFSNFLESEIDRVKRYGGTFSIIFFDLDHFKKVNDEYGHLAGDTVLKEVAELVGEANRSADIFARYGGEEFIILTPSTDMAGAIAHAERLRTDIENNRFNDIGHLTCSFGVAEFIPEKDDMPSIFKRADSALYNAKRLGRNRVESN
ncbi:MAG: GGDEF domain-containing protein [Gammaproteobacteria bacterium]|nr:GGDEF domain-containing protein [Gammaproteobacteria bacterium]